MTARVSIGSTYADAWYIVCWVFGGLFLLIALIVAAAAQELLPALILAGVGVVFFLLALIRGMGIAARRRWMTATPDGFVLEDRRGEFEFDDAVITDLGTWAKVRFANGEPKAVTRTGALFIQSEEFASRLEFRYEWPLNQDDPLGKFIERNLERLTEQAVRAMAAGREVSGDDWVLDRGGLTYAEKGGEQTVGLKDLTAVDIVDGKVCVWRAGEPMPVVKVPAPSPNALVLYRVLTKRFEGQPPPEERDDGSLGRVIFERDKSLGSGTLVLLMILAVLLGFGGGALIVVGLTSKPSEMAMALTGFGLFVLAGLMVFASLFFRKNIFRCHAFGIARVTTRGETQMRFKDMRLFTYMAVRNYVNGAYSGTNVTMRFEDIRGEAVKYSATFKNADDEIENLREHVSRVMAGHMLKKLQDGKTVQWTDRVRFTAEGLEIAGKSGLFGKSDDLFIPYGKVADATLNAGQFALIAEGRKKPVYETTVGEANFFPGYVLLILIRFTPDEPAPKPRRPDDSDPEDFRK